MYYVFSYYTKRYNAKGEIVTEYAPRLHTIKKNIETEAEAQQAVRDYDATHKRGPLGRVAGYDDQRR